MLARDIDYLAEYDLESNYRACMLAICRKYTPDRALAEVGVVRNSNRGQYERTPKYSEGDIEYIRAQREKKVHWADLGEEFGVTASTLFSEYKRMARQYAKVN